MKYFIIISILLSPLVAEEDGLELYEQRRYYEALPLLTRAVAEQDADDEIKNALFHILYISEEYTGALDLVSKYPELLKKSDTARDYAFILLKQDREKEAFDILAGVRKDERYYEDILDYYFTKNLPDKANNILANHSESLDPAVYDLYSDRLAVIYQQQLRSFEKLKNIDAVIRTARNILKLKPDQRVLFTLANYYYLAEDYRNALDALKELSAVCSNDNDLSYNTAKLKGMTYVQLGRYDEAATVLSSVFAVNSYDYDANYYLGLSYYKTGRTAETVDHLKRAVEIKRQPAGLKLLASAYLARQQYDIAEKLLAEYIRMVPEDVQADETVKKLEAFRFYDEGSRSYRAVDYAEAESYFRKAKKTCPEPVDSSIDIMLAKTLYMRKYLKGDKRKENLTEAVSILVRYLSDTRTILESSGVLMEIYQELGDVKALKELTGLLKKNREEDAAGAYLHLARSLELKRDHYGALSNIQKAWSLSQNSDIAGEAALITRNLVISNLNTGKTSEAQKILSAAQNSWGGHTHLVYAGNLIESWKSRELLAEMNSTADTFYARSDYQKALTEYEKIILLKPEQPGLLKRMAFCYYFQKNYDQAALYFKRDLKSKPSFNSAEGHLHCLQKLKKYNDVDFLAEKYMTEFKDHPDLSSIVSIRINNLNRLNRTGESKKVLNLLLARESDNPVYNILLGNTAFLEEQYYQAEASYARVYKNLKKVKTPGLKFITLYNLAVVKHKRGELDRSLELLTASQEYIQEDQHDKKMEYLSYYTAVTLYKMGKFKLAEPSIDRAINYNRKSSDDRKGDYLNNIWWFVKIYAKDIKNFDKGVVRQRIYDYLDECIKNNIDADISEEAEQLKIILDPGAERVSKYQADDFGWVRPVYACGYFIYQLQDDRIIAMDAKSGESVWTIRENAPLSTELKYQDYLYLGLENGFIKAVDIASGEEVFRIRDYADDLIIKDGEIYYVNDDLVRLSESREVLRVPVSKGRDKKLYESGGNIIVLSSDQAWAFRTGSLEPVSRLFLTGALKTGFQDGYIFTVDSRENNIVNLYTPSDTNRTAAVRLNGPCRQEDFILIYRGCLVHVSITGDIKCYKIKNKKDPEKIAPVWSQKLAGPVNDLYTDRENLYLSTREGKSYKLDLLKGELFWDNSLKLKNVSLASFIISRKSWVEGSE